MDHLVQIILISVILTNLAVLGSHPLNTCIRAVALQGVALGVLPIFLHGREWSYHTFLIPFMIIGLKGFLIPTLLFPAIRDVAVRKEQDPLIGFTASLLLGGGLVGLGFAVSSGLPLPAEIKSSLLVPVALSTLMMGLLVIVTRAKILTQTLGYLMLENGIFAFGLILTKELPWLIEMGVSLDIFAGIFVMGTLMGHIHEEFNSLSVRKLSNLKG